MYVQVLSPVAPKGSKPIPVNPDALANVLAGTDATALQQPGSGLSGYVSAVRGVGCAGGCHCGGKCGHGMGQADSTAAPSFLQTLTDPISADISTLTQQLQGVSQQATSAVNATSDIGLATWVLVGLSGFGIWYVIQKGKSAGRGVRRRLKRRRGRIAAADSARFSGAAFGDV